MEPKYQTDEEIFEELFAANLKTLEESQTDKVDSQFTTEPELNSIEHLNEIPTEEETRVKKPSQNARLKEEKKSLLQELEHWKRVAHEKSYEASTQANEVKKTSIAKLSSDFDLVDLEEKSTRKKIEELRRVKNNFLADGDAENANKADDHIWNLTDYQSSLKSKKDSLAHQYLQYNKYQPAPPNVQLPQTSYAADTSAVESFYKNYPFADNRGNNPNFSPQAAATVNKIVNDLSTQYKLHGRGDEILNHNFMAEIEQKVKKEFNLKPLQGGNSMRGAPIERRASVIGDITAPSVSSDEKRFLTAMADEFGFDSSKEIMSAFKSAKNGYESAPNYDDI